VPKGLSALGLQRFVDAKMLAAGFLEKQQKPCATKGYGKKSATMQ
jgi:hypothetical protein